ncbi:hypothetical protein Tco_0380326, partial [Tanacetum coccineum]
CCEDWKLLFFNVAACIVAAICFCCYSILLLREDLSRNLELTELKPSLGEDFIPAGSSSSIPTDYVSVGHVLFLLIMFLLVMFSFLLTEIESAGHVLVYADRDRIC